MNDILIIVSSIISAISTVVIAYFTFQTKKSQDSFQEKQSDLYQALVIATLQSSNTDPAQLPAFIEKFKAVYKGKTTIFK